MNTHLALCARPLACVLLLALAGSLAPVATAVAANTLTLGQLKQLALQHHPSLQTAQAQVDGAQAGMQSAASYPNPEVELFGGPSQRRQGGSGGSNLGVMLSQPLDMPALRERRQAVASANSTIVEAGLRHARITLLNQVESVYLDVLRQQAALKIATEDVAVLTSVRDRVEVRVKSGEGPKFDQIKAETELLNAEKNRHSVELRLTQAKMRLQALVGSGQLVEFELSEEPLVAAALPERELLWSEVVARNPELDQSKGEALMAANRLKLERQLRQPQLTLKAGMEQDADMRNWRVGVALPLPLWNQRQGPIGEAVAGLSAAESQLNMKRLVLRQELDSAYSRHEIAQRQVESFEEGLLRQTQAALKAAEAAYRFGERGILDYLDAERTYRMVRLDFLNARYELHSALLDIARLRAQELFGETP